MGITSKPGQGLSGQSLSLPESIRSPFRAALIKRSEAAKRSYRAGSPRKVTPEEFERDVAAVDPVRPHDADAWRKLLRGLWLSTYGVGTLRDLAWSPGSPAFVDTTGEATQIAIREGGFDSTVCARCPLANEM